MTLPEKLVALDHMFPPYGPCGFCGGPDKRHRHWDAVETSVRLDWLRFVVHDLDITEAEALALVDTFAHARRLHRPLPGRYPLPEAA